MRTAIVNDIRAWKIERVTCGDGKERALVTRMCGHKAGLMELAEATLDIVLIPCGQCIEDKRKKRIKADKCQKKHSHS